MNAHQSNSATAPRICRMSLAVGPLSVNWSGLSAAGARLGKLMAEFGSMSDAELLADLDR